MIAARKGTEPGLQTHSGPFNLAAHLVGEIETALKSHKRFNSLALKPKLPFRLLYSARQTTRS
jgi:hypothetical protein